LNVATRAAHSGHLVIACFSSNPSPPHISFSTLSQLYDIYPL
jgi:hypothetical protein